MSTPHDVRYRIVRLMKVHDRSKLGKVDSVLDANKGKEEELIKKCVVKYGPEPAPEPFHERVERFFRARQPNRASESLSLASKYAGRETDLIALLAQQLGAEPDPPTPRSQSPRSSHDDQRVRLSRFYQHYAPEKGEGEVDKAIEKYGATGEFDKMWTILEKKYGPEKSVEAVVNQQPSSGGGHQDQRRRLIRFYQHYAPEKGEGEVDKAIEKYGATGDFDKMWTILEKKYGPEKSVEAVVNQQPSSGGGHQDQRRRLIRFYQHYAPEKGEGEVDKAIEKYGATGDFDKMWTILEKKYGPENEIKTSSVMPVPLTTVRVGVNESQRERLRRFYARYAPEKTENDVDTAIERYSKSPGGFEQMWATLEKKYGPEDGSRFVDLTINADRSHSAAADNFDPVSNQSWLTLGLREHQRRLASFYAFYVPEKSPEEVLRTLHRYTKTVGGVTAMWDQLQKKYGPEPKDPNAEPSIRDRLKKFFAHYAPEKTEFDIDASVKKYGPTPQGFEEMWSTLERRFGPEDFNDPSAKPRSIQISKPSFNITSLLPPTSTVDDDPKPLKFRKVADLSRVGIKTRQIGANQSAIVGSAVSILHVIVKLFGAEFMLYERAPSEKRAKFRDSIECDIALNSGMQPRNVRAVRLTAGAGILCEVDIELPPTSEPEDVSSVLLSRISSGSCTCAAVRDSYRKDLGGNPVQLFFEDLTVLAGFSKPHPMQALVANGRATFSEEILGKKPVLVAPDLSLPRQRSVSYQPAVTQSSSPAQQFPSPRPENKWNSPQYQAASPFLQSLWESNAGATNLATQTRGSPMAVAPYGAPQQVINPLGNTYSTGPSLLENQFASPHSLRSPFASVGEPQRNRTANNFSDIVSALRF